MKEEYWQNKALIKGLRATVLLSKGELQESSILMAESISMLEESYTQTTSKIGFGQRESFRNSSILSGLILGNMRSLKIGKLRCFGAAENPIFEVV